MSSYQIIKKLIHKCDTWIWFKIRLCISEGTLSFRRI